MIVPLALWIALVLTLLFIISIVRHLARPRRNRPKKEGYKEISLDHPLIIIALWLAGVIFIGVFVGLFHFADQHKTKRRY